MRPAARWPIAFALPELYICTFCICIRLQRERRLATNPKRRDWHRRRFAHRQSCLSEVPVVCCTRGSSLWAGFLSAAAPAAEAPAGERKGASDTKAEKEKKRPRRRDDGQRATPTPLSPPTTGSRPPPPRHLGSGCSLSLALITVESPICLVRSPSSSLFHHLILNSLDRAHRSLSNTRTHARTHTYTYTLTHEYLLLPSSNAAAFFDIVVFTINIIVGIVWI